MNDLILQVEIDPLGRLIVQPKSATFPLIYREAMEVGWDPERHALFGPNPREWTYQRWFVQIVAAALEQGVRLHLSPQTQWTNVPSEIQAGIEEASAQ